MADPDQGVGSIPWSPLADAAAALDVELTDGGGAVRPWWVDGACRLIGPHPDTPRRTPLSHGHVFR
ncbi:hypothetical protein [Streptomyces hainanensis]|uniref:Uncharacterized protein n=1 Tax=Streptomyces hainanensis TaxID=402648 RepID=A0A4R4SSH5_9ACTN|nr:hypothetical protein [Streptomyces hainanensis]TDC65172.1 hypothetical protein E1283_30820 [Streptomyces hainanensis]